MTSDVRLIEAGFPCHQVGAETQRERDTGQSPPPNRLHVWWARRPLTPSRAAIIASLSPAGTNPETFIRQLGIEVRQAMVNGVPWIISGPLLDRIQVIDGKEFLPITPPVLRALANENTQREENLHLIQELCQKEPSLTNHPAIQKWREQSVPLPIAIGEDTNLDLDYFSISRAAGDPAWFKDLMDIAGMYGARVPNMYGYDRAYSAETLYKKTNLVVLDPTSGGGSIPFEALRLGHTVIANELNPVATTILHATLDYPLRFGSELSKDIENYGKKLIEKLDIELADVFKTGEKLPDFELQSLKNLLRHQPELIDQYNKDNITSYLYTRQVTCPHCGGEAPLLNTCWLSKETKDPWGVSIVTNGALRGGKVFFETYRIKNGRGPNGENPDQSTVSDGVGQCVHCKQAIDRDEIKIQARGESPHGKWIDRLYCVVAVRLQPKLDKDGNIQRYTTGERAGQIKTEKVRYFRPLNSRDLEALKNAEFSLREKWDAWDDAGLIPTEEIPPGHRRDQRDIIVKFGITRWLDMFMPRQILGHVTLIEELIKLKPEILKALGQERGKAVVTYLQFAIDKVVDYNSKHTRWEFTRGVIKGTFGRHDFSLKWTFGEMILAGPNSGAAWGLSQVLDAYEGIASLTKQVARSTNGNPPLKIINGSATSMSSIADTSVDLVCMDPPYYNNVQYAELSDFFYVWQKRALKSLYPELFSRRMTNKTDEAVANPYRDSSKEGAKTEYERIMADIFRDCRRVLKENGVMTLMFTHKEQDAWETLTRSLIESGWEITASFPVESEGEYSTHQKDVAAAASSIFITCRKRPLEDSLPSTWTGMGGSGVASKVREAVKQALRDFEPLRLNPVDRMVASYGRALQVLSQAWPVMDGDEMVGPTRAMNEAASVVSQQEIHRITNGSLSIDDLDPESAMALTLFGIFGLGSFSFDEANNVAKSLNIHLEAKAAGYRVESGDRLIGYNQESTGRRGRQQVTEDVGYYAPLVRKGSKLRLALPTERSTKRLEKPQGLWDVMQGALVKFDQGEIPVAKGYLDTHAKDQIERFIDLLEVWASECGDQELKKSADKLLFGLRLQTKNTIAA